MRVGARLLAFVERLRRLQRAPRREPEAAVGVALQRGQIVEERCGLRLLLALDRLDRAVLAAHALGDRARAVGSLDAGLIALEPEAAIARVEGRVDEPIRLRDECLDLPLPADDHRKGRRLDASERDDA